MGRKGGRQWQMRPLPLNIMMNRGHAEVLPIFSSTGKLRRIICTFVTHQLLFMKSMLLKTMGCPVPTRACPMTRPQSTSMGCSVPTTACPKDSNGLPKESSMIDNDGLTRANNGLTKDSAAFEDGGLPHDDSNGLPKDLAAIDPAPTVKSFFFPRRVSSCGSR